MDNLMAYCGLNCSQCPTFLATQQDDRKAKETVAALWSKQFAMKLTAQDISCDGCKSGSGRVFGHCKNCRIKSCCSQKQLDTCAECAEYACEHLSAFFAFAPHAKESLEKRRKTLS